MIWTLYSQNKWLHTRIAKNNEIFFTYLHVFTFAFCFSGFRSDRSDLLDVNMDTEAPKEEEVLGSSPRSSEKSSSSKASSAKRQRSSDESTDSSAGEEENETTKRHKVDKAHDRSQKLLDKHNGKQAGRAGLSQEQDEHCSSQNSSQEGDETAPSQDPVVGPKGFGT